MVRNGGNGDILFIEKDTARTTSSRISQYIGWSKMLTFIAALLFYFVFSFWVRGL